MDDVVDYTPTTGEIKAFACRLGAWSDAAFERWLNSIKAGAWDEGERAGWGRIGSFELNPYRDVS